MSGTPKSKGGTAQDFPTLALSRSGYRSKVIPSSQQKAPVCNVPALYSGAVERSSGELSSIFLICEVY